MEIIAQGGPNIYPILDRYLKDFWLNMNVDAGFLISLTHIAISPPPGSVLEIVFGVAFALLFTLLLLRLAVITRTIIKERKSAASSDESGNRIGAGRGVTTFRDILESISFLFFSITLWVIFSSDSAGKPVIYGLMVCFMLLLAANIVLRTRAAKRGDGA